MMNSRCRVSSKHSSHGVLFLAFVVTSCVLFISCRKAEERPAPHEVHAQVGGAAPDFILKDLSGRDVQLSRYQGSVVLVEFWATWCPPCRAAIPDLEELLRKYGSRGFTILSISMDTGSNLSEKLLSFQREYNISYPVLLGDSGVSDSYNVRSIPALFLITRQGTIAQAYMGYSENFVQLISGEIDKLL